MKKLSGLLALALLLVACKKEKSVTPPALMNKMSGKWTIVSVTTVFRDTTGTTIGSKVYPEPQGDYFKFNADGTWLENLTPDGVNDLGITGYYTLNSDSTFSLQDQTKTVSTPFKISSISASQFIFSHQKSTLFNGTTPGSEEYIFLLSR